MTCVCGKPGWALKTKHSAPVSFGRVLGIHFDSSEKTWSLFRNFTFTFTPCVIYFKFSPPLLDQKYRIFPPKNFCDHSFTVFEIFFGLGKKKHVFFFRRKNVPPSCLLVENFPLLIRTHSLIIFSCWAQTRINPTTNIKTYGFSYSWNFEYVFFLNKVLLLLFFLEKFILQTLTQT